MSAITVGLTFPKENENKNKAEKPKNNNTTKKPVKK